MSYDIELCDPVTKEVLLLDEPHQIRGGTYAMGGTRELHLNITYNYSKTFIRVMGEGGLRSIYGKTGAESIPILDKAFKSLSGEPDPDYWKECDGNVKEAILHLLLFAQMRPEGIWVGD